MNGDGGSPEWFREIDHTGDIGIEVTAADLKTLFERAAWAMFAVLAEMDSVRTIEERQVQLKGSDRSALLVRWLSELNFIHITEQMLFSRFEVRRLTDHQLEGIARGEPFDRARHVIHTEIKAVTYHGLAIRRSEGSWCVQVIFDM